MANPALYKKKPLFWSSFFFSSFFFKKGNKKPAYPAQNKFKKTLNTWFWGFCITKLYEIFYKGLKNSLVLSVLFFFLLLQLLLPIIT